MQIDKIRLTASSDKRPVTQKQMHNTKNEKLESTLFEWVCVAYWFVWHTGLWSNNQGKTEPPYGILQK
jgi:hypothetical protein